MSGEAQRRREAAGINFRAGFGTALGAKCGNSPTDQFPLNAVSPEFLIISK
jgi:hypothetical protein